LSYDPQRAIERHRRLDEIEAELKTIEKKLYWRQGNHWRAVLACRYLTSSSFALGRGAEQRHDFGSGLGQGFNE
jgi:hypothetical protein